MKVRTAAIASAFTVQGAAFGSTIVRLPELRDAFGLDYAGLGLVLLAPALGGLLAVPAAAALAARIGGPRTVAVAAVWWALAGLPIVHTAPRVELLAIVLVAWGAGFVATDVGANTSALAIERDTGRSVLSRMHGCFSGGALIGALAGGSAAQFAVPLGTQLICAAVLLGWAGSLVAATAADHVPTARQRGLLAVAVRCWPLVAVAALGLMAEGAVGDWTAVHLTDLGAGPLLAASGFAVFQVAMLVGRMTGDRVIDRWGRLATIRACALAAALIGLVGYTATALTASVPIGIAATAAFGLALAPVFPAVIAHGAAIAHDDDQETAGAAVASGGYVGVLLGPPIIGQAAQIISLSWAMLVLPALLASALVLTTVTVRRQVSLAKPVARPAPPIRLVLVAVASVSIGVTLVAVQVLTALTGPSRTVETARGPDAFPALAAEVAAPAPPPTVPGPTSAATSADVPAGVPPRPAVAPPGVPASVAIPSVAAVFDLPAGTPGDVTLTPDGRQAWVAHREAGVLSVTDLAARAVVATVAVPAGPPRFVAFCAGRAWVSVYSVLPDGSPDDAAPHAIAVIDTDTLEQVAVVPVGRRPFASSCTPDETRLIVPSHDDGRLDVIDTTTMTVTRSVPVAPNPHWVAVTSEGTSIWTANHESNVVTALTSDLSERAQVLVGASPHAVAVSPDDATVAVANFDGDSVSLIDAATAQITATIAVAVDDLEDPSDDALDAEGGPQDLVWSADGRRVLTVNVYSGQVSVIDAGTGVVTATLPVPSAVGIAADDTRAYVTSLSASTLTVLDLTQETP